LTVIKLFLNRQNRKKPLHFSRSPQKEHLLPGKNPEEESAPFQAAFSASSLPTIITRPGMMNNTASGPIIPASNPGKTDHQGTAGHARMKPNRSG